MRPINMAATQTRTGGRAARQAALRPSAHMAAGSGGNTRRPRSKGNLWWHPCSVKCTCAHGSHPQSPTRLQQRGPHVGRLSLAGDTWQHHYAVVLHACADHATVCRLSLCPQSNNLVGSAHHAVSTRAGSRLPVNRRLQNFMLHTHRHAPGAVRLVVEHEPVHRVLKTLPQRAAQCQSDQQRCRGVPRGAALGVRPRQAPADERQPHQRHDPPAVLSRWDQRADLRSELLSRKC